MTREPNYKTIGVLVAVLVVGAVAYRVLDPAARRAEVRAASSSILGQTLAVVGGVQNVTDALALMQAAERADDWIAAVSAAHDGKAAVKVVTDARTGLRDALDGLRGAKEFADAGAATVSAIQDFDESASTLFTKYAEGYEARRVGGSEPILVEVEVFNRALRALDATAGELVRISSSR